jgi:hypothetical protein
MSVAQVMKKAEVPGLEKQTYEDNELIQVHINLPKLLWKGVDALAKAYGTTKTNVVVRALNKEAFFARVIREDPKAQVVVEHGNGDKELVSFV